LRLDQIFEHDHLRLLGVGDRAAEPDHPVKHLLPFIPGQMLRPDSIERVTERTIFLEGFLTFISSAAGRRRLK
jgi:hypothetical protein